MLHRARKRFGQNFLHSSHIINRIIASIAPKATDNVIEIGPGLGALTIPLLNCLNRLTVIEIDTDLQKHLASLPIAQENLNIIAGDALAVNYGNFGSSVRLVGNLPYNISTPLLFHLLLYVQYIEDMHFMLQKEVVERLAAQPGTRNYGRLSVMLQYYCDITHLFNVPPTAFNPQPQVESAVVRLNPYRASPYPAVAFDDLERIVAGAFSMRRKTLANNLKPYLSADELRQIEIDPQLRPEQISVLQYSSIVEYIAK